MAAEPFKFGAVQISIWHALIEEPICEKPPFLGLSVVLPLLVPAYAAGETATCKTTAAKVVTSNIKKVVQRGQGSIPIFSVSFEQGGTAPGCVLVHVSIAGNIGSPFEIKAVLDGKRLGSPGPVANNESPQFLFISVSPGLHSVEIEYRSTSGTTEIENRVLTVFHAE